MNYQSTSHPKSPEQDPSGKANSAYEILSSRISVLSRTITFTEEAYLAVWRSMKANEAEILTSKSDAQPVVATSEPEDAKVFSLEDKRNQSLRQQRDKVEDAFVDQADGIDVDDIMKRYEDLAA